MTQNNENPFPDRLPRLENIPLREASLYRVSGKKQKFIVSVIDEHDDGLGCFYAGEGEISEGDELYTTNREKTVVRWSRTLNDYICFFGLHIEK